MKNGIHTRYKADIILDRTFLQQLFIKYRHQRVKHLILISYFCLKLEGNITLL
jgi:hypothetical protein